jgi:integrase
MMGVRKRKWGNDKSAWLVDYRDQSGKRRFKTFERKADALAFESSAKVEVRQGIHTPDAASITVEAAASDWLKSSEKAGLEPSSLRRNEQHIRRHIVPFIGAKKLSQLTVPGVNAFEDELREAGRSPAMVKAVMVSLSGILADAQRRGRVARNVVRERTARRSAGARHKRRLVVGVDIPSPAEVRAIIGGLVGHYRDLILVALFTGLRASELRGLDWDDVGVDGARLHVRQRADFRGAIGSPKTAAAQRAVPLPPIVVNALRARKLATGGKGLVFGTSAGKPDDVHNVVRRGWWPAQVAAGVTVPVLDGDGRPMLDQKGQPVVSAKYSGIHSARHWFASWCINPREAGGLGLDPKAVQERMGHSTIAVTLDIYGHLFPRPDDADVLAAGEAALLRG